MKVSYCCIFSCDNFLGKSISKQDVYLPTLLFNKCHTCLIRYKCIDNLMIENVALFSGVHAIMV